MTLSDGLVQRKKTNNTTEYDDFSVNSHNPEEHTNLNDKFDKCWSMTLMEQIMLLGLKDFEGHTSFWNDYISPALRGCILVELCFRKRIRLAPNMGIRKKSLLRRHVELVDSRSTGEVLLDEALRHIKELSDLGEFHNTEYWVELLSGETWNPLRLKYQLKNLRERILKQLTEKGVLGTEKQSFVLFDVVTHPVADGSSKKALVSLLQSSLLSKWQNDLRRFDKRVLSLVYLAHSADVLDPVLDLLSDETYNLAMKHISKLLDVNFENEAVQEPEFEVMWAVFDVFSTR
ncbi:Golgi phosphoprotein 3 homolog sauron-like isoform X2 [Zophobas morio]|uniref:Golgi phosphoprotein 3 homolog sauron-like isoform X2 n=1 Tax=Zophobas morio TaxID=2755281 RepID=UPI003082A41F